MKIRIEKSRAVGEIYAPPSKSVAHRVLIAAALSGGESEIFSLPDCDDVKATISCLQALGVQIEKTENSVKVHGKSPLEYQSEIPLDCNESGSTLRFFIPLALLSGRKITFTGSARLMERPQGEYEKICKEKGVLFERADGKITVQGPIQSGEYTLLGNVSSQFITGLLFALCVLRGKSIIRVIPPFESKPYIHLTVSALKKFGAKIKWLDENTLLIKGGRELKPRKITVEGDYSGAAFLQGLKELGGRVKIRGLNKKSEQGDKVCATYLRELKKGYCALDISDCPDLAPILFAFASVNHGGKFLGTARLKIKESDRASAMQQELEKFGVNVSIRENETIVHGGAQPPKAVLYGHNDHRIVMALCVLMTKTGGEIDGAEAVKKSYPNFFEDLQKLGIGVSEI